MDFQECWDYCAQNKTSEISKHCTVKNSETPVRRTRRRKTQQNALSNIMGLLCAEQNVGNLNKCTFKDSGTPVRRTQRRNSLKLHVHKFWHSGAQRGAAFGRSPSVVFFVLALNKAHVLALNTAHVLRLNKADVLALNKAHVLRLNAQDPGSGILDPRL